MSDVQFENFNLQAVNHAFSAVWKYSRGLKKAGWLVKASADGTTKDTTGIAANDKWGGNADPALDVYPVALDTVNAWICLSGPSVLKLLMNVATTGTFVRGEKVTQATSGAEGELHGLDMDGALVTTTVAVGSNGVNVNTFAGAGVLNVVTTAGLPPAGGYVNVPALNATIQYTALTATTLTGCTTLFAGAGVLATGQVVNGANGHASIIPRNGTFDGTHAITGAVSGATFTPYALKTYIHEIVLFKNTDTVNGIIFHQCVCAEDETANRFSVLAANSGCTATLAPGAGADASNNWFPQKSSTTIAVGSNGASLPQATINVAGTQNAAGQPMFPSSGIIAVTTSLGAQLVYYTGFTGTTFTGCTGGAGSMTTGGLVQGQHGFGSAVSLGTSVNGANSFPTWFGLTTQMGKALISCTNVIGAPGVSPDGTAWVELGSTGTSTGSEFFGLFRLDDCEDAELDPYVFFHAQAQNYNAANVQRTAGTGNVANAFANFATASTGVANWRGNRRRGWLTQDPNTVTPQTGDGFMTCIINNLGNNSSGFFVMGNMGTQTEVEACGYAVKRLREKFWLTAQDPTIRARKGSLRWVWAILGNNAFDTFDGKLKMIVIPMVANSSPGVILGPLDGTTVPSQA